MKTRDIAVDTLEILKKGHYFNSHNAKVDISERLENSIAFSKLFTPFELEGKLANLDFGEKFTTQNQFINDTTLNVARGEIANGNSDVLCLNFASGRHPGGGFLNGAVAQEESIARASGLYLCLQKAQAYYDYHNKLNSALYSHHMIYTPYVPVFKDEKGNLLDKAVVISFISSAAVNVGAIKKNEPDKMGIVYDVMRERINTMLCLYTGHKTLVLGAWGCGVFQNDPEIIANLFYESLSGNFKNKFKKIIWAIYSKNNMLLNPFENLVEKLGR